MQKPAAQPRPRVETMRSSCCGLRHETCRPGPRTQCGPGCVWPPQLQRQLAETPDRRHLIANSPNSGTKSGNWAFTFALLFGQRMDDRTLPSLERFSTQQTLPQVGMGSRCWRNHFIAGGNMKSKSLFCDGEQLWHEQFCQTHRREQTGFSLVSVTEQCTTGDMSPS